MASHDPRQGDRPDLPSSQHQQRQGRTQARAQATSEREDMPIEARTPEEARRAVHAGRDQPAGMGLGNAARPSAGETAADKESREGTTTAPAAGNRSQK